MSNEEKLELARLFLAAHPRWRNTIVLPNKLYPLPIQEQTRAREASREDSALYKSFLKGSYE